MCRSAKQGTLLIALCGALVLLGIFFSNASEAPPRSSTSVSPLHGGDRAMLEMVLERYKVLARNVTRRVESLERAVLTLRERRRQEGEAERAAERAQVGETATKAPTGTEASTDAAATPVVEGGEGNGEDKDPQAAPPEPVDGGGEAEVPFQFPDIDEDPEETEEERAKRQEAEEKQQREMILFNESNGTYRRWRGDFRCGSRVPPLPDGEMVECPPGFDAPCCSALGWCGRSADHCKCEMCSDYRHKAKVTYAGIKLKRAKRECETIAADLGPFSSPEECAQTAVNDSECGKMIMFSFNYPNWGCRCCAIDTPEGDEEKDAWNVYAYEVIVEIL